MDVTFTKRLWFGRSSSADKVSLNFAGLKRKNSSFGITKPIFACFLKTLQLPVTVLQAKQLYWRKRPKIHIVGSKLLWAKQLCSLLAWEVNKHQCVSIAGNGPQEFSLLMQPWDLEFLGDA